MFTPTPFNPLGPVPIFSNSVRQWKSQKQEGSFGALGKSIESLTNAAQGRSSGFGSSADLSSSIADALKQIRRARPPASARANWNPAKPPPAERFSLPPALAIAQPGAFEDMPAGQLPAVAVHRPVTQPFTQQDYRQQLATEFEFASRAASQALRSQLAAQGQRLDAAERIARIQAQAPIFLAQAQNQLAGGAGARAFNDTLALAQFSADQQRQARSEYAAAQERLAEINARESKRAQFQASYRQQLATLAAISAARSNSIAQLLRGYGYT